MNMYSVEEQHADKTKAGLFYIKIWLLKGYRFRFHYLYRDTEHVDHTSPPPMMFGRNVMNVETNYIDVPREGDEA